MSFKTATAAATGQASLASRGNRGSNSHRRPIARRRRRPAPVVVPATSAMSSSPSPTSEPSIPSFIPASFASEVTEPAARSFLERMKRIELPVEGVSPALATAVVGPSRSSSTPSRLPPVVCLHGFDSSCLEFRRLEPLLSSRGVEVWCPDLVGWGFTDLSDFERGARGDGADAAPSLGPEQKRRHLYSFWENVLDKRPMVLLGTSLGGGIAIDFALRHRGEGTVAGLSLVAPQAYAEGIGPLSTAPRWLAKLGVKLLRSVPLRQAANKMAYYDVGTFATDDAMRVGRLHTHLRGWEEANVAFMESGGYSLANDVKKLSSSSSSSSPSSSSSSSSSSPPVPTLLVWGRDDEILDPKLAERFREDLPRDTRFVSVDECGHCPHLEQPEVLAQAVVEFLEELAKE